GRLVVDLVTDDVTFRRLDAAVEEVASLEHGARRRTRELLLGRETPRFDRPGEVARTEALNPEQPQAVQRALAPEAFFSGHGPPGTGKSPVLPSVARAAAGRGQLLRPAASNAAVDHLLGLWLGEGLRALRIGPPARVSPRLVEHPPDVQVEGHPDRQLARSL